MIRKREYLVLIAIASLLCCWTAIAPAAEESKQEEPVVMSEAQKKLLTIVSVNYKDTPIDEVVTNLAEQANVDIIKSPQVIGTVTATINNAPLGEVLENILALNEAGFVATDRVIRIVPRAEMEMQKERRVHKVYRISYADVRQVAEALKGFASQDAELGISPGTGNIVVTDTESKIKAIDEFLEEIDRPVLQVLIEVRIYDITSRTGLDLGVNWIIGTNTGVSNTDTFWRPADTASPDGHTMPFVGGTVAGSADAVEQGAANIRFGWLNSVDIDVLIQAQQEDVSANLLANPRLLVLDNETASFKSIEEIPYQELQQTAAGGAIGTVSFKEVGVLLNVTPHITRDNMLRIRVLPEFSTVTRFISVAPATVTSAAEREAFKQPVIDTRKTDTTLLIRDGQTIVMSGMRKKETNKRVNKVPLLGDVPVVGALFRTNSEKIVNRELVVFLTPRIVAESSLNQKEQRQLEKMDSELSVPTKAETPVLEGGPIIGEPQP